MAASAVMETIAGIGMLKPVFTTVSMVKRDKLGSLS